MITSIKLRERVQKKLVITNFNKFIILYIYRKPHNSPPPRLQSRPKKIERGGLIRELEYYIIKYTMNNDF